MQTERFWKNIIDQIKELQLKLGYARETVRLYYPASSLNGLLGTEFADDAAGRKALLEAVREVLELAARENGKNGAGRLTGVKAILHGDRFALTIPPEGAEYVHQQEEASEFLQNLISLFQVNHDCSLEDICKVFEQAAPNGYIWERMPEGTDFDYVFYFKDALVDEYYYCVKMEMGHTVYHRFMKEDYEALF